MSTPSINNTSPINPQEPFSSNIENRESTGELDGISIAETSHNPVPTTHQIAHEQKASLLLRPFVQVGRLAHTLWNSVPPFAIAAAREQERQALERFMAEEAPEYARFELVEEILKVRQAHTVLIELPSWGYHLTARQAYENLRTVTSDARVALQTARAAAPPSEHELAILEILRAAVRDDSPDIKGAYHINHVGASTRADDVAQADDAVVGRGARTQEIPEATVVADDPENPLPVATALSSEEEAALPRDTPISANYANYTNMVYDGAPIAKANYVQDQLRIDAAAAGRARTTRLNIEEETAIQNEAAEEKIN